jgi:hypothetical protein
MLPQGEVSKKVLLSRANRQRVIQKVFRESAMQYGVPTRPHGTKQVVEKEPFSLICQSRFHSFRGSFSFVGDDGVLGADRVLDPSGTETW